MILLRVNFEPMRSELIQMWLRFSVIFSVLLLTGGCAVIDYKQPIDSLHEAVSSTASTVEELDRQMTEIQNDRWRAEIENGDLLLSTVDRSCAAGTQKCSLQIEFRDPEKVPRPFPATSLIPKGRIALRALSTYTAGLKAISDADTASKITTSANEALGNLANIERTIAEEDGVQSAALQIEEFREPMIVFIEWAVSRYVERVKVKALATATQQAQPVMEKLSTWYAIVGDVAGELKSADARDEFIHEQEVFDDVDPPSGDAIDVYVNAVSNFDAALKASSTNPLDSFLDAHTKLKMQLNNEGNVTLAEAMAAIEHLADEALAFKAIVDEFEKVLEQ